MRWRAKEKADPHCKITTEHMSRPGECCGFLQSQNSAPKRLGSCWREVGKHLCRLIRSSSSRRRKDSSWSMKPWNREMQDSPDAARGKLWLLEKESEARPELAEGRGQGAVVASHVPKGPLAHLHTVTSPHTQTTSPSSRQSLRRWTLPVSHRSSTG